MRRRSEGVMAMRSDEIRTIRFRRLFLIFFFLPPTKDQKFGDKRKPNSVRSGSYLPFAIHGPPLEIDFLSSRGGSVHGSCPIMDYP